MSKEAAILLSARRKGIMQGHRAKGKAGKKVKAPLCPYTIVMGANPRFPTPFFRTFFKKFSQNRVFSNQLKKDHATLILKTDLPGGTNMAKEFMVETSARHVHVNQETLEILFGKGYQLTEKKALSQPGQYASNERITVVGAKKEIPGVSILGPCRAFNQVELSATDARSAGIDAPVRESGDIKDSGACKLVGPAGEVELKEGAIVAKRHVHMTPKDAEEFGVKNGDIVAVLLDSGNGRKTVYGDTVIRVSEKFALAMHIDTDESNAAACGRDMKGTIVKLG